MPSHNSCCKEAHLAVGKTFSFASVVQHGAMQQAHTSLKRLPLALVTSDTTYQRLDKAQRVMSRAGRRPNMLRFASQARNSFCARSKGLPTLVCLTISRGVSNSSASYAGPLTTGPFAHSCDVDAEPLHRYKRGGYHPIHLGDCLNQGRYRILHKLGWGGHSTVWAAKDQRLGTYVAVKISVSERQHDQIDRCLQIRRAIKPSSSTTHPGAAFVMETRDHFKLDGPNGTHECLVLELLGPSITDILDVRFRDNRLPAKLARRVARQVLLGLDYLHQHGIGHGGVCK